MAMLMKRHMMSSAAQLRFEPLRHRVRATVGDAIVVDTTRALLVWEPRRLVPVFAVPPEDIAAELVPVEAAVPDLTDLPPFLGPTGFELHTTEGQSLSVRTSDTELTEAAFRPTDPDLGGCVVLSFDAFTRWFEEDQELVGHAHDPFKRIDTLTSGRQVVVSLNWLVLADSKRPTALLETHLPIRWYLPREDVRMDLLVPSEHRTTCAYKGRASYFSLASGDEAGRDIAWTYPRPRHDALPVRDMLCFWSERTDLILDGVAVQRPITPWSPPEQQRRAGGDSLELG